MTRRQIIAGHTLVFLVAVFLTWATLTLGV